MNFDIIIEKETLYSSLFSFIRNFSKDNAPRYDWYFNCGSRNLQMELTKFANQISVSNIKKNYELSEVKSGKNLGLILNSKLTHICKLYYILVNI